MQKCKEIIHVHQKCGKHHDLANSVMTPHFFIYTNRNMAEPREVTKQVVWINLRHRIFHGTFRHIRSGFPSYARTVCALTLLAYALKIPNVLSLQLSTLIQSLIPLLETISFPTDKVINYNNIPFLRLSRLAYKTPQVLC